MGIFRDSLSGLGMRSWSVDIALLLSCPAGAVLLQFGWWRTWYANVSVATAACMSYADFLPPTLFGVSHAGHEVNIWSVRSWKHIFRTNTVEQCGQHLGDDICADCLSRKEMVDDQTDFLMVWCRRVWVKIGYQGKHKWFFMLVQSPSVLLAQWFWPKVQSWFCMHTWYSMIPCYLMLIIVFQHKNHFLRVIPTNWHSIWYII